VVRLLTADPPEGSSRRTVIEYETLGAAVMAQILARTAGGAERYS
jgi:hypothetical protein